MENEKKNLPDSKNEEKSIAENINTEDTKKEQTPASPIVSEFTPLDELLYDMEEALDTHESPEETESYESFLADYRLVISENLRAAKKAAEEKAEADKADEEKKENAEVDKADEEVTESEISESPTPSEPTTDKQESDLDEMSTVSEDESSDPEEVSLLSEIENDFVPSFEEATLDEPCEPEEEPTVTGLDSLQISLDDKIFEEKKTEENNEKYNPEKPRKIDTVFEIVELFIMTLVAVMVVTSLFFRHSVVDGSSMQNTLQDGDHLIISSFLYTPDYGDIVVFEDTESATRKALVKRVIGLEGDTVEIKSDGSVYVNGVLIEESYVYIDDYVENYVDRENTWTVGEGEVFVLGDHRNVSADSRKFGTIDVDTILGKAILRFYPFSGFGIVK